MGDQITLRQRAMRLLLQGLRVDEICARLACSRSWVYKWWRRYQDNGPDGLRDRSRAPRGSAQRVVSDDLRQAILKIRDRLVRQHGPRDRYRLAGAPTIRHELAQLGYRQLPSLRTIERVLQQEHRTSPAFRLAPACTPGADLIPRPRRSNQVPSLDLVGPRYLCGARARYYFLVYKDIYDQAIYIEFHRAPKLQTLLEFLVRAWQHLGLPTVLVADNDPIIATPGRWPGSLNRLWRLVRLVGVELRRIPEGEPWFNGSIENFNGWFPPRLLAIRLLRPARVRRELAALMGVCNNEHIHPQLGFRTTAEARKDLTMRRLPANFNQHHRKMALPAGKVTFLRRVRRSGRITVLSVRLNVGKRWAGR